MGFTLLGLISTAAAIFGALTLFLLGIPHGATERLDDTLRHFGLSGRARRPSLSYTAIYLVFGILVFASWLISPQITLLCFLALSAWHFGRSEPDQPTQIQVTFVGAWVITGSCLIYPDQTLNIFAWIMGQPMSVWPETLPALSRFAALGFGLSLLWLGFWKNMRWERVTALLALFILLPPVPAVATYFFVIHSLGETARTLDALPEAERPVMNWLKIYAPASAPALMGATGLLVLTIAGIFPVAMAAGLAIAFIIPHMVPLEKLTQAASPQAKQS